MTVPISPVEASGATLAAEIRLAGIARKPGDAAGKTADLPPLWIDAENDTPAPGTKQGVEDDTATVLGVIYDGEIKARRYAGTRTFVWGVWIRCKGDRPARRAESIDKQLWDLLQDRYGEVFAVGQDEQLMVHGCAQWTGLQKTEATTEQGHTYVVKYAVTVYA